MLFWRVILVQGGECEEKKIKDQVENPYTSQPTPQKRRAPCYLISPCTRQGPLSANAPPLMVGCLAGSVFVPHALWVAIILQGAEGLERPPSCDLFPLFNNANIFFCNGYLDVSERSIQNAGVCVCVCCRWGLLSTSDLFSPQLLFLSGHRLT